MKNHNTSNFSAFEADAEARIKQTQDERYDAMGEDHMGLRVGREISSEKAQLLNDRAELEIWGSGERTYNDPTTGEVIASLDNPYPGRIESIRNAIDSIDKGGSHKERQDKAARYEADVLGLVDNGYELCQAKLIMDLREADQEAKLHMITEQMRSGKAAADAESFVNTIYAKKSAKREQMIKDMAILDSDEYEKAINRGPQDGKTSARPNPTTANNNIPKSPAKTGGAPKSASVNKGSRVEHAGLQRTKAEADAINAIQDAVNNGDKDAESAARRQLSEETRRQLGRPIEVSQVDNSKIIDGSVVQELDKQSKALTIAQEELKRRQEQEEAGQEVTESGEQKAVDEPSQEQAGKLQRVREALGKMSLKRTLEYLGLREKQAAPTSPDQADNQPHPNRRLSEAYRIEEVISESQKDHDQKPKAALPESAISDRDKDIIASRRRRLETIAMLNGNTKLKPFNPLEDAKAEMGPIVRQITEVSTGDPSVEASRKKIALKQLEAIYNKHKNDMLDSERELVEGFIDRFGGSTNTKPSTLESLVIQEETPDKTEESKVLGSELEGQSEFNPVVVQEIGELLLAGKEAEASILYDKMQRKIERQYADSPEMEQIMIDQLSNVVAQLRSIAERAGIDQDEATAAATPESNGNGSREMNAEELAEARRMARGGAINPPTDPVQ